MNTIRILIADDHPLFLEGIRAILAEEESVQVVAEAADGIQAIELAKKHNPDIVVMDITMPNMDGIEATKAIKALAPKIKVIALSIHSGKQFVKDMLNAGASGYLLKDSAPDELVIALQKVSEGDMYLSSAITHIALMKEEPDLKPQNILYTKLHKPSVTMTMLSGKRSWINLKKTKTVPLPLYQLLPDMGKACWSAPGLI